MRLFFVCKSVVTAITITHSGTYKNMPKAALESRCGVRNFIGKYSLNVSL